MSAMFNKFLNKTELSFETYWKLALIDASALHLLSGGVRYRILRASLKRCFSFRFVQAAVLVKKFMFCNEIARVR
ncbi:predicted protein [Brucella abortus bv. 3 str. Tulya]|nr:predicted protein [Brucella abortus bv. 3 str. Tulya]